MAKPYRMPDFRKLYPEASEEVIAVLRTTERKMQYQEYDLKVERTITDEQGQIIEVIPSREDSYERLLEMDEQFAEDAASVEEQAIHSILIQQLHKALSLLSEDERLLMEQLYFEGRTGVYHNAIHKQKNRVLDKLKKILEKFCF